MRPARKWLTISVVSHSQGGLVAPLLEDLDRYCDPGSLEVILTVNVPETLPFNESTYRYPLTVIENPRPKGFGANHNAAFRSASGIGFCVLNPDVRFSCDPFEPFRSRLEEPRVGVAAPLVTDSAGRVGDSARRMPTPARILRRILGGRRADYDVGHPLVEPDWVAGIFMLLPARVFREAGGFDERYHMYCEDVDLCTRLRLLGYRILQDRSVWVVHDARRKSHRNWIHLAWHVRSLTRFFLSDVYEEARRGCRPLPFRYNFRHPGVRPAQRDSRPLSVRVSRQVTAAEGPPGSEVVPFQDESLERKPGVHASHRRAI